MLDTQLRHWLDEHAEALDLGQLDAEQVLPQLAQAGLLRLGVPTALGGSGGSILDAVEAVAQVASHSLTAAFVFWGQRSFIEFLLQSDNAGLRERLLGDLLSGRLAGASGLSNAMKHLCGIEQLGISSQAQDGGWWLEGRLPWVTNLRKAGFVVAAAIEQPGAEPFIAAIDSDLPGLSRSDDLQLLGMQSSNTAALVLSQVSFKREALIASQAKPFLARVRPAFLGLQCAMGLGLARRALQEAEAHLKGHRTVLSAELEALQARLQQLQHSLRQGLQDQRFITQPTALFELRIGLAEVASQAVQLELQASGGKAYLQAYGAGFARRWRESAFVPIITPSLVQLRTELRKFAEQAA